MQHDPKTNILLSICIPTYNQPKEARRLLESILPQITPEVELVVRDDSTNDETKTIVEEFSKKVQIRYFRGKKEGLDVAILFLTQEARGKYVWWLGDDVVLDGAAAHILEVIKKYPDISFIWLNSADVNDEKDVAFHIGRDGFFKDRNEVLRTDVGQLGFISATIFRRSNALGAIEPVRKYIGSAWVNLYIILHVLSGEGRQYFINKPYILSQPKLPGEKRWYEPFQVFGINLFRVVGEFKDKFDKRSARVALGDNFGKVWRSILVERAKGFTTGFASSAPKVWPLFKCYWNFAEFWVALPLLLMPRPAIKLAYASYKMLRAKRHGSSKLHRNIFRKCFSDKSETDFPGGYIPNRFFLERIDGGPVLVVGDYRGRDYPAIKKKINETYLLDIVQNNIADKDFFIFQSVTDPIPFSDNFFRYVVVAEVIEHVWEDRQALAEIRRVLSPEGRLILTAPLLHDFPDHHFHIYSPKSLAGLLHFSGFSVAEKYYRGLLVSIPNEVVASMALLLYPIFRARALNKVNAFFYRVHKIVGRWEGLNSLFRFSRVFKGYGMTIVAKKYDGPLPDPVEIQRESFCA